MSSFPQDPTIFACATGALPSAIAIIRVSGPNAAIALESLTNRELPQRRKAVVRALHDADGALLDNALVLWMRGPATATGEDLVELHLHGSRAVVSGVEAALAACDGCRAALPGEFTRRAFENGVLDLSQVEGLADLLSAETVRQREAALAMSEGGLRRRVEDWQACVLGLAARIEATIDHDDEDDVALGPFDADVATLGGDIDAALASPPAERLRDGVRIGIAGPPNVGKSTLINALSGREAAIVSDIAGTTRDLIEVPVVLDGAPLILTDTAGLRDDGDDAVERIGIARARDALARCDVLLWLGAPSEAPTHARCIRVAAKSDVMTPEKDSDLAVSARTGAGMADLRARLSEAAAALLPAIGDLALSQHQRAALADCRAALADSITVSDPVLKAESFRAAMAALDRITGRADTEAMLEALFGRFCIGK